MKKGYPHIWDQKEALEKEIIEIYNSISNVIKQYEERISSLVSSRFKPVPNYDPEFLLTEPIYYQELLYSCLFKEINKRLNDVPPSPLNYRQDSNHKIKKIMPNKEVGSISQPSFYVEPYFLAEGEHVHLEEFWKIFEGLRADEQLVELVKSYNNLMLNISKIDFSDFYTKVDELCKAIRENRTTVEGKCKHCPEKNIVDLLLG